MRILLIDGDTERGRTVRGSLPPDGTHFLQHAAVRWPDAADLSRFRDDLLKRAERIDVALIVWDFEAAPAINTLTHAFRDCLSGPSVVICERQETVEALAAGADAVVHPPIDMAVVEALVLSHRRLVQVTAASVGRGAEPPWPTASSVSLGGMSLDPAGQVARYADSAVQLTPRETALLSYLARNGGRVCTREELLDRVWGIRFETGTNMVDVYVHFLRRRLDQLGWPYRIATVRGSGYRLEAPADGPDRTTTGLPSDSAR